MYPHERSLVKRLEGKPFALIGVNSDEDRDELKKVLVEQNITWRSFWNGGSPIGPISRQWQVEGWPSIWIIDARGVIRYKQIDPEEIDQAVDALLAEMGQAK
jgi:Thioredoxin-like